MARGQPDYGVYQPKKTGGTLADLGDLAVRLGSIVEFDRRGDIVYLDDFEDTVLKWSRLVAVGGSCLLNSDNVKSGSQAVKISTIANINSEVNLYKSFVILGTLLIGIEISICDLFPTQDFYFSYSYWDGFVGRRARIWFNNATDTFYVDDTVRGNWTMIAHVQAMRRTEVLFYAIKLVVDFETNRYKRMLFAGKEYDLSGVVIPPAVLAGGEYFQVTVNISNTAAAAGDVWVDDFILTQNEP